MSPIWDEPDGLEVYTCAEHGVYHFGNNVGLTAGPPPNLAVIDQVIRRSNGGH